ncbi:peptide-methionine (R)-S-oxide reductase MsrB [Luteitalea sp.]
MLTWKDVVDRAQRGNLAPPRRVEHTDEEWRARLTPAQYHVMRQHGTERAFSSEMCSRFEPGQYACAGCQTLLFDGTTKFESGTGWPSFAQPATPEVVAYTADHSYGMVRIEATCAVCDAHLGHVFPDGPAPSGLRYCMNALSLEKVAAEGHG